jgi:3-oxoacyl-[acyl-carrier protein] reductase
MLARGCGHVIFVSSFSAVHPPPGLAAYATAKAALLGLTRDLAGRCGSRNIRVNSVLPGFLETRMTHNVTAKRRAAVLAEHVLGTFNTPAAVAGFLHFLHHRLPHTSGQVFQLDSRLACST